jgi:hypothetical protein
MLSCENVSWLSIFPRHVVDAVLSRRLVGSATAESPRAAEKKARVLARINNSSRP